MYSCDKPLGWANEVAAAAYAMTLNLKMSGIYWTMAACSILQPSYDMVNDILGVSKPKKIYDTNMQHNEDIVDKYQTILFLSSLARLDSTQRANCKNFAKTIVYTENETKIWFR